MGFAFMEAFMDAVEVESEPGKGTSVLELVRAFERATGMAIPYKVTGRRPGDLAAYWADTSKAEAELNWHAEKTIEDMCRDSWRFQKALHG